MHEVRATSMPLYGRQPHTVIKQGFDPQNLNEIKARFLALNDTRLAHAREALHPHQRIFLDALALLFHSNHPMMPGFISQNTPCGIAGFRPSKADIARGKTLASGYCSTAVGQREDIWSLFIMGSAGTIAHNHHSDLDIWVCHRPDLSISGRNSLQRKCEAISRWAKKLGLDVHCFLMNHEDFHQGKQADLDEEASGTAQRFLLLDEFYRTALYIAGRMPAWWFVAPDQPQHYQTHLRQLLKQGFLRENGIIDFGDASNIPLEEYFGAGIWQLYKAIAAPHKSVLKLLLIESYLYLRDKKPTLSHAYKQAVYEGQANFEALDPYLMAYQHIEHYLKQNQEFERIEMARRCFYLKVDRPLFGREGKSKSAKHDNWQRRLLRKTLDNWQWPEALVQALDQHQRWSALQVKAERNQLVHMLNLSYRALADCAKQQKLAPHISEAELLILERKLHAAFERRPGKLDWLNLDFSSDVSESELAIVAASSEGASACYWQLYAPEIGLDQPLKQTQSLTELALWCHANKLVRRTASAEQPQTRWNLKQAAGLTPAQLAQLFHTIRQWAPDPRPAQDNAAFKEAAAPLSVLLIINGDADSLTKAAGQAETCDIGAPEDAFNFGREHENLVHSVDIIVRNSWDEYVCHHTAGEQALEQTLDILLSLCVPGCHQRPPEIEVESIDPLHGPLLARRLAEWLDKVHLCYYSKRYPSNTRFVYASGTGYCSLQFQGPRHLIKRHADRYELYHFLGETQRHYSPIILDHFTQRQDLLSLAAEQMTETGIQVFFQKIKDQLLCYILDEKGSLCSCSLPAAQDFQALYALQCFLQTVTANGCPVTFFQAKIDSNHALSLTQKKLDTAKHPIPTLKVRAFSDSRQDFKYDFFLDQQSFLWSDYGAGVFEAVARFFADEGLAYLTDVDLENYKQQVEASQRLQTSHYLRVKLDIENKLHKAINAS